MNQEEAFRLISNIMIWLCGMIAGAGIVSIDAIFGTPVPMNFFGALSSSVIGLFLVSYLITGTMGKLTND